MMGSNILSNIMMFKNPLLSQQLRTGVFEKNLKQSISKSDYDDAGSDLSEAGSEPEVVELRNKQIFGPVAAANIARDMAAS